MRTALRIVTLAIALAPAAYAQEPEYPHGDFTGDCSTCHEADRWSPARIAPDFRHEESFPLRGAHKSAPCRSCHAVLDFSKAPTACADCHTDPHLGELGTDCAECHTPTNFLDRSAQLERHRESRFPLVGAHATQECESCHRMQPQGALRFVGTDPECVACHLADYQGTTDPNHVQAGFPTDCVECHTPTAWDRASVDHDRTGFPLTGRHRTVPCTQCHTNGFAGTPTDCYACHASDYNGTTDPNHAQGNFPTDCAQCHTTSGWDPATFDHQTTGFPLTGAHTNAACQSCHSAGYTGTPTDCFSCHASDYNGTTDPNHAQGNFPTDCTQCHTTTAWDPSTFNHQTTGFALTGAHTTVACQSCHSAGYSGTPTDCFSCHASDYNGTTDPNHAAAGFPTDCTTCHTTTRWDGAQMPNHDALYFPIYSGSHRGRWNACSDCHTVATNFASFSCFACHGQTETNGHHSGVPGYAYDSNLCYSCHPTGRAG